MLSFVYGVYSSLFVDKTYKVLIIGLESSGKTTLIEQLKYIYAEPQGTGGAEVPRPAPANEIAKKCIRPTIGLNMSRMTHRTRRVVVPRIANRTHPSNGHDKTQTLSSSSSSSFSSAHATLNGATAAQSLIRPEAHTAFVPVLTHLMVWDVGGSLRTLWANYFAACHAVIYVVDSTLGAGLDSPLCPSPMSAGAVSADEGRDGSPSPLQQSLHGPNGHTPPVVDRVAARRRAFAETAAVLRAVFRHPLLEDAPLLILSNKSDVAGHCSLAEVQEALGLIEMALMPIAYEDEGRKADSEPLRACASGNPLNTEGPAGLGVAVESRGNKSRSVSIDSERGTSGIGKKIMRLMETSTMNGTGVCEAMDWLVGQIHESKREAVETDE